MITREMLINAIENAGLQWYSIHNGQSPYATEYLLIMDDNTAGQLKLYQGHGKKDHAICVFGKVFDGHKVALKELESARWTRPGYRDRGHDVVPYRVFLDECPNDSYKLYEEVGDVATAKAARDAGAATVIIHGEAAYESILLVEDGFCARETCKIILE